MQHPVGRKRHNRRRFRLDGVISSVWTESFVTVFLFETFFGDVGPESLLGVGFAGVPRLHFEIAGARRFDGNRCDWSCF